MVSTRRPDSVWNRRILPARVDSHRAPDDDSPGRQRTNATDDRNRERGNAELVARRQASRLSGRRWVDARPAVLDLATNTTRALETGSNYDTFPSWSPRGDWIVFTSKRDGDYEIYRIRPDGTQLQRLTRRPGPDAHPSFSPDGEWIAFATGSQGFKDEAIGLVIGALPPQFQPYGEIAVMRAAGSDLHVLTDDAIEQGTPVWVPGAAPR
jgi:dipeptidyl aminopeptidase/acylaminoacyl peptidase